MREIVREPNETPSFLLIQVPDDARKKDSPLVTIQEKYTKSWTKSVKRYKNKSINTIAFNWFDLDKELRPLLLKMTDNHCSFCDRKFDEDEIENSVELEHFKPKIKFPESAYSWKNIFIICRACNKEKNDDYTDHLLKPDENYKFEDYFRFNYKTGELITINEETIKAQNTIDTFKLNREGLCRARNEERKFYEKYKNVETDINEFSYRNYLEKVSDIEE